MDWMFLVIDSSEADAAATDRAIGRVIPGATVVSVGSGEAALARLEELRAVPSMVFLAYDLPDMNGIQFLGRLRERSWLAGTPVTLLGDPVDDRVIVTCYRLGASACLSKPVRLHELRETIRDFGRFSQKMASASFVPGSSHHARETAA